MTDNHQDKNIVYVHDFQFYIVNNNIYTAVGLPEDYFERFLNGAVCKIKLLTRTKTLKSIPLGFEKISNRNISCVSPNFSYTHIFNPFKFYKIIKNLSNCDFVVINYPSIIGLFCSLICIGLRKNYSLEFAADVDQFSSKKMGFFLTFIFKLLSKYIARKSVAAIYVSEYLREKYPSDFSEVCSNVKLDSLNFTTRTLGRKSHYRILFAGGLNKRKGITTLLKVLSYTKEHSSIFLELHLAGGHSDNDYGKLASQMGLASSVIFHGILNNEELTKLYIDADIYMQPSISEGIPRATLEAMSYGLPVIATNLPGFKEILDDNYLFEPNDIESMSHKLISILSDNSLYKEASQKNLDMVRNYSNHKLSLKRSLFYKRILNNECT